MMARAVLLFASILLGVEAIQVDDNVKPKKFKRHTTPQPPTLAEILRPFAAVAAAAKKAPATKAPASLPKITKAAVSLPKIPALASMSQKSQTKPSSNSGVSILSQLRKEPRWDKLRGVVLFVGANKTGSSLISTILNAHPRIMMPNEYNLLDHLDRQAQKIYHEMHSLSVMQAALRHGYSVEGQWQGLVQDGEPYLIGDKKVVTTENELDELVQKIRKLGQITSLPIYLVHLTNPATKALGGGQLKTQLYSKWITSAKSRELNNQAFLEMFQHDPTMLGKNAKLVTVDLQAFTKDPAMGTTSLCQQLGVECSKEYVDAVTKMIKDTPPNKQFW